MTYGAEKSIGEIATHVTNLQATTKRSTASVDGFLLLSLLSC
jgi:hypothetical protein